MDAKKTRWFRCGTINLRVNNDRKVFTMKKAISLIMSIIMILALTTVAFADDSAPVTIYNPRAEDNFELFVKGSTGYALIDLPIHSSDGGPKASSVPAGQLYRIITEGSSDFQVQLPDGSTGWVSKTYTMVNLPDVLPSIRYNATNSYDSLYRSCGKALALTGTSLYTGKSENAKLGYAEYNMPVLYTMAKKIAFAQATALSEGYTLVLYEGFRPREVQSAVNVDLQALMNSDSTVNKAITNGGWGKSWFIATSVSNHQKGFAIDISLAKIEETETITVDGRPVIIPSKYTELEMPTAMHELSPAAATLSYGVNSKSDTAWRKVPLASTMTDGAKKLQAYCVAAGMSPLASEWWHFNDLVARAETSAAGSGLFYITGNMSGATT